MSTGLGARKRTKPTAIDIFCGCGGTTQGLRDAGFRVLAGIEIEPLAVETYRKNHPRVRVWDEDIRLITPREVMAQAGIRRGELDLLTACPPCQAFSALRRLNGSRRVRDKASKDLVFEYLRFVEAILPKVLMFENVPRLTEDYRFAQVRQVLKSLGYDGTPMIFDAADFGVPQRRKRMIFIASRIGDIDYAVAASSRRTVKEAIGNLPRAGKSGDPLHDFPEQRSAKVAKLISLIPKNGGSRLDLGAKHQLACHRRCDGFKDVFGRMRWDDVAPTITSGCVNPSKGRFLHPTLNRCISLREAALLQSFPRDYWFSLAKGKYAAALMIGNAFPPEFVRMHARQIRLKLQGSTKRATAE